MSRDCTSYIHSPPYYILSADEISLSLFSYSRSRQFEGEELAARGGGTGSSSLSSWQLTADAP